MKKNLRKAYAKTLLTVLLFACILPYRSAAFAAEPGEIGRPTVYVESYTVEGSLAAGEDIIINFNVINESRQSPVNDILLNVTCSTGAFFPSEGQTSQYYVSGIAAGGSAEVKAYMTAANNLPNGSYDVSYSLSYQDSQRNAVYSGSGMIALSVMSNSMEIVDADVPEQAVEGRLTYVSVRYSNTGTAELRSARIVADGNIDESGRTADIGTVRAAAGGIAEMNITFTEIGSQQLALHLEYEDEAGEQVISDAYVTSVNVAAGAVSNPQEFVPPEQSRDIGSQMADFARDNALIIIAAIAFVCAAAVIITLVRKKRK